jgi:hypothetical protein
MYSILDAYSALMIPFFVVLVVLGQFFCMGLFLAVLCARYARVVTQMSNAAAIRVVGHLTDSGARAPAFNAWRAALHHNDRARESRARAHARDPHHARELRGALFRWFNLSAQRAFNSWRRLLLAPRIGLSNVRQLGTSDDPAAPPPPPPWLAGRLQFLAGGPRAGIAAIRLPSERPPPRSCPSPLLFLWPPLRTAWYLMDLLSFQMRRVQAFGRSAAAAAPRPARASPAEPVLWGDHGRQCGVGRPSAPGYWVRGSLPPRGRWRSAALGAAPCGHAPGAAPAPFGPTSSGLRSAPFATDQSPAPASTPHTAGSRRYCG